MKKLLSAGLILFAGWTQNSFADEKTVEQTVESTRYPDGSPRPEAAVTSTAVDDSRLSKGGLFIEPILMVSQEDTTIKASQLFLLADDTSGTSKGYGVGLRFGGHISEILLIGVDARYSKVQIEDSFYTKSDADVYNIAPMVGLQTPIFGIRLMAGYVVFGENNPRSGIQGLDLKFKEASGWRIGAGLHVAAVAFNIEYQDLRYNTTEIESFGSVAVNRATSVDADSHGYSLSLSFPVEL